MIRLERYSERHIDQWEEFVSGSARNSTFLHSRKFFSHNPDNAVDDCSLMFFKGTRLVGVFPAAIQKSAQEPILNSHPRSTYGGFVVSIDVGIDEAIAMVNGVIDFARSEHLHGIRVRNPFRIFHALPSDETDYAMWRSGFHIQSRELEVAIQLNAVCFDDPLPSFEPTTRNQVRKALKSGLQVSESEDYPRFWEILERSLDSRHQVKPTHDLAAFQRLLTAVSKERIKLFGVFHGNRMIAGCVVFVANAIAAHCQYMASEAEFTMLCPMNALVYHLVIWSKKSGFQYLNLGMSTEDGGMKVNAGLFKFKEGFMGRSVLRETMYLPVNHS